MFLQISMFCVIVTSVICSLFPQGGVAGHLDNVCLMQGASEVVTPLKPT